MRTTDKEGQDGKHHKTQWLRKLRGRPATRLRNRKDGRGKNPRRFTKLNPTKQDAERSPGNFAYNPEKASEAGRKGGTHSHIGSQHH
ncbi:MAG TPA: KGG domain-containing protein [Rhizomicrobium sp.]|nr:KGG domain-containing protein [Rhizomicrobium sp.]